MGCSLYACKRLRGARRCIKRRERRERGWRGNRTMPSFLLFFILPSDFSRSRLAKCSTTFRISPRRTFVRRLLSLRGKPVAAHHFRVSSFHRIREKSYLCDTTLLKSRPSWTGNFCWFPRRHESTKSRSIDKNFFSPLFLHSRRCATCSISAHPRQQCPFPFLEKGRAREERCRPTPVVLSGTSPLGTSSTPLKFSTVRALTSSLAHLRESASRLPVIGNILLRSCSALGDRSRRVGEIAGRRGDGRVRTRADVSSTCR